MSLVSAHPVTFNSTAFSTVPDLTVLRTNPYITAKRRLSSFNIARSDRSKHDSAYYDSKLITIRCSITGGTRQRAEAQFDQLMALLQGREKDLVVQQSGAARRYIATLGDVVFIKEGTAYLEFDLVFTCADRFGYDTNYTTLLALTSQTAAQRTDAIGVGGSAPTQVPKITVLYSAISGGTGATVAIGNGLTGQQVFITRNFVAGDEIVIDAAYPATVKVNGAEVPYTGAIPEFANGTGSVTYNDNFTTRTYRMDMNYYKRWV